MSYADIELINGADLALSRRNIISEKEVKRMHVNVLVDSNYIMLAINERIQEQLKLPFIGKKQIQLSNGQIVECDVVGPLEIKSKNIHATSDAIVLPGDSQPQIRSILLDDSPVRLPIKILPV